MNANDKELIKIEKTQKKRLETKTVYVTYPDCSYKRVSNCIKIIGREHVVFILQEDYKMP